MDWQRDSEDWPHRERSRFTQAGGLTWHVQVFENTDANAPVVLLLHGTGASTHSWREVAPLLVARGYTVQFITAMELLGSLVKGQQQGTLEVRLAQYSKPKLLIVDELGYLPLEPQAGHLFFQLISRRYEQGSVLISSNRPVEEWDEVFGDQVVAAAILDRLMHHSHVVTIRGDSYRLREKRRAGLFRPRAGSSSSSGIGGVPPPTPDEEA